jgi:hypothetical protein
MLAMKLTISVSTLLQLHTGTTTWFTAFTLNTKLAAIITSVRKEDERLMDNDLVV